MYINREGEYMNRKRERETHIHTHMHPMYINREGGYLNIIIVQTYHVGCLLALWETPHEEKIVGTQHFK